MVIKSSQAGPDQVSSQMGKLKMLKGTRLRFMRYRSCPSQSYLEPIISASSTILEKFFCYENEYGTIKNDSSVLLPLPLCISQILSNKALTTFLIFKTFKSNINSRFQHLGRF